MPALEIALVTAFTIGLFFMPLGIPVNFLISVVPLGFYFSNKNDAFPSIWYFIVFLIFAILGEVCENLLGMLGAKKYNASKWGMFGAFAGGIAGGIIGTGIFPVIGTLIGVLAGGFFGTFLLEFTVGRKKTQESIHAGYGAMIGKLIALSLKFLIGLGMIAVLCWRFWFV